MGFSDSSGLEQLRSAGYVSLLKRYAATNKRMSSTLAGSAAQADQTTFGEIDVANVERSVSRRQANRIGMVRIRYASEGFVDILPGCIGLLQVR